MAGPRSGRGETCNKQRIGATFFVASPTLNPKIYCGDVPTAAWSKSAVAFPSARTSVVPGGGNIEDLENLPSPSANIGHLLRGVHHEECDGWCKVRLPSVCTTLRWYGSRLLHWGFPDPLSFLPVFFLKQNKRSQINSNGHVYSQPHTGKAYLWSSNLMPNILEKFWPKWWDVAPCTPRPVTGIKASTVVVKSPPGECRGNTDGTHGGKWTMQGLQ